MKTVVRLLVAVVLSSLMLTPGTIRPVAAQDFATTEGVIVNTDALNVRSDPGLHGAVLSVLPYGTHAVVADGPVEADGYTWYAINADGGESGWVASEYLATASSGGGFGIGDGVRVMTPVLNIRDAPSASADVFTTAREGTVFTISSAAQPADGYTWYQVHSFGIALPLEGNVGWVAGEFLVADPAVTGCEGQGPCPTGLAPGDGIRVATDALNLRGAPGLSSAVGAVLPNGTQGVVADGPTYVDGHAWLAITTDEYGAGWVAREFIVADPSAGGAPEFSAGAWVQVVDGALNLREGPTLASDVVDVMADGAPLTVTDGPIVSDGYTWFKVTSDQYGNGWAAGEFLRPR
ncbi:MAG TPA: SH3 domain-containing protein [Thermomicrobiales bacterium]|nr:SH3 domain-containing protein [Thermomicrobiales bacterium]